MDKIYKHFACAGIVFCITLALFITRPASVFAQEADIFTVEGVTVDVTAKNAVEARTKALDDAQVKAYRLWLEKNLTAEQAKTYPDIDPVMASSLVKDFEITKEQVSATRYKGVFTVRFRPHAMKRFLPASETEQAASADSADDTNPVASPVSTPNTADVLAGSVLVLPFYQVNGKTILWEGNNPARVAWSRQPVGDNPSLLLPLGDLTDMDFLKDNEALTYNPEGMHKILSRYRAQQAAIVMTTPNAAQGLDVNIYSARPGERPRFIRTLQIMPTGNENTVSLYDRAVTQVKPLVLSLTYAPSIPAPYAVDAPAVALPVTPAALGPVQNYTGYIHFSSVQEWVKLKNMLDRLPGMKTVMVKKLNPRRAELDMNFAGDITALSSAMAQSGMTAKPAVTPNTVDVHSGVSRF